MGKLRTYKYAALYWQNGLTAYPPCNNCGQVEKQTIGILQQGWSQAVLTLCEACMTQLHLDGFGGC